MIEEEETYQILGKEDQILQYKIKKNKLSYH